MQVHNMMESLVSDCLKDLLHRNQEIAAQLDDAKRSDILAIALNRLPAKYVSTASGEMFAKTQLRAQHETDVYRELSLTIDKVLRAPRTKDF